MKTLIHYEKKKLLRRKSTVIVCLFMVLVICLFEYMSAVLGQYWFAEDGSELSGTAAIQIEKDATRRLAGPLTEQRLAEILAHYHAVNDDPANLDPTGSYVRNDVYIREELPYRNVYLLMWRVYSPLGKFDTEILDQITDAGTFYMTRTDKVHELIAMYDLTQAESETVLKLNEKVSDAFTFDYTEAWKAILIQSRPLLFLLIALAVCVTVSPVFAFEYQTGADAVVLSAKLGRGETVRAKITAGFLVTTGIYALGVLAAFLFAFAFFGVSGWNCDYQIISENSFYALKIWQVALFGVIINYIVVLAVAAFTMLLSAACKTSFTTVVISIICTVIPIFLPDSDPSVKIPLSKFFSLLPVKAMDTQEVFSSYTMFSLGNIVITLPWMIIISVAVLTAIFLPIAHRRFCRHQVL